MFEKSQKYKNAQKIVEIISMENLINSINIQLYSSFISDVISFFMMNMFFLLIFKIKQLKLGENLFLPDTTLARNRI